MTLMEHEFARLLANVDGDGLPDEFLASGFVLAYKMREKDNADIVLTVDDMRNADVDKITNLLNKVLKEIIFDDDVCSDAWWKNVDD